MSLSKRRTRLWMVAVAVFAASGVSSIAFGAPLPQIENGVAYVSGGIGQGPQRDMQAMRKNYNLLMTFATKSGDYLSDVTVTIRDATGRGIVSALSEGPFFFANLPAGRYSVFADYLGNTQVRLVNIRSGKAVDVYLYWTSE